ncbi:MAG: hypothetical protein IJS30_06190 [Bacteroidales bacterium]|nr:hypothetical protein [Bacteroidales bacterium]
MRKIVISIFVIMSTLCHGAFAQPVTQDAEHILSLGYLGFRDNAATAANFQKLAEAGLDMLTLEMDQSTAALQFDLAAEAGIKILAVLAPYTDHRNIDEVEFDKVDELVERFRSHPALFGWHICDEPNLNRIPDLKMIKEHIEAIDPDHPVYINLNPLGSIRALGTDFYRDYVDTYARDCGLSILSYDCYPTMDYGVINWWYMCNEAVLVTCRKYGIPFWGFAATCWIDREGPNNMHVKPTLENVRLTVNTHLAYGAKVMQYFTIRDFGGTSWSPMMGEAWTDAYDLLKEANLEMKNREAVFASGEVVKTRFTHLTPFACLPLIDEDLPDAIASIDTDITALVSFIEKGDERYIVVVNSSWTGKCRAEVEFARQCSTIDRFGVVSKWGKSKNAFIIDEGDMLIIKY